MFYPSNPSLLKVEYEGVWIPSEFYHDVHFFSSTTADGLQPVTTVPPDDRRQVWRPRSTQHYSRQLHTGVRDGQVIDGHVPAERHRNDRNYQNYLRRLHADVYLEQTLSAIDI